MQRLSTITHTRFSLLRFRSPLLTESQLFSLPMGTKMFHFPTFPPTTLYIQVEVAGHNSGHLRGYPIRKSTDQSSFTNSPWLIAGYNVLHRLLMPRHPPTALSSLPPIKYTNNNYKDARVHYPQNKQPTHQHPTKERCTAGHPNPTTRQKKGNPTTRPNQNQKNARTHKTICACKQKLPRKEVIQPHLPVRLPCYDLVLITDPTFDSSLPKGLGHRLRVLPTFMT